MLTTKMKLRFIEDLKQGFESSAWLTPEFASFARRFKSDFTKYLGSLGATNIVINRNHFELYGFFTTVVPGKKASEGYSESLPHVQAWYFATGDVRWSAKQFGMLVRTAKDYKDYTGGRNQSVSYSTQEMFESGMRMVLGI